MAGKAEGALDPTGILGDREESCEESSRAKSAQRGEKAGRPRLGEAIDRSSHFLSKDEDNNGSAYRLNLRKDVEVEREEIQLHLHPRAADQKLLR